MGRVSLPGADIMRVHRESSGNEPVAETTESDVRGNERFDLASVLDEGSARAESVAP